MADTVKYRFVLRRGLAADWVAKNEILLQGEFGLELDTGRLKIGDGTTVWNKLGYFNAGAASQSKISEITIVPAGSTGAIGNSVAVWFAPFDCRMTDVGLGALNAATSGDTVIDLKGSGGTTILASELNLAAGAHYAEGELDGAPTFAKGDYVSVDLDELGSGVSGLVTVLTYAAATADMSIDYLIVGGGGGGGLNWGGGGGGGGVLSGTLSVTAGITLTVVVGAGGAGSTSNYTQGANGGSSSINSIIAQGGGGGGSISNTTQMAGADGASGGGGTSLGKASIAAEPGGAGIAGQGFVGGAGYAMDGAAPSGGGGGAAAAGADATATKCGDGGAGATSTISGATAYYGGGGGGGGSHNSYAVVTAGAGGLGGGGNGATADSAAGSAGMANTGGGGGGGATASGKGGNGGSGVVIIRAPTVASSTTGSPQLSVQGSYYVYTFSTVGTWSITF